MALTKDERGELVSFYLTEYQPNSTASESTLRMLFDKLYARITVHLGRDLLSTDYSEVYQVPTGGELVLRQPDVTAVMRVCLELDDSLTAEYSGSDTHATVEVTDTAVVTRSRVGTTTTTTTSTFAANVKISDMVTTIDALGGWSASTVNDGPSAYLHRQGVIDADGKPVTLQTWADWDDDYRVDYGAGTITAAGVVGWSAWSHLGQMLVEYTAGASALPDDIQLLLLEMCHASLDSAARDGALQSEKLGDYAYTLATADSRQSEWHDLLARYKRELP